MRKLVEKYRKKKKRLFMVFIDLEKVNDRVPREVLKWALMRKKIPKMYINVVENMYEGYEGSCTNVKSMCEETQDFRVRVGVP